MFPTPITPNASCNFLKIATKPRRRTHIKAAKNVTYFVLLNSCRKILRRLEYGTRGPKFGGQKPDGRRCLFDILTRDIGDFPERAHKLPFVDPTPTNSEQSERQRFIIKSFMANRKVKPRLQDYEQVYDSIGRQLFHCMLATHLIAVRAALLQLQTDITEFKAVPIRVDYSKRLRDQIKLSVSKLSREIRPLSEILFNFEEILGFHLKWLSEITDVVLAH